MYTVIREDVRPSADIPFFQLRIPYVDVLFVRKGLTRNHTMSEDGLTRTVTFKAPSKEAWEAFINDARFRAEFLTEQDKYNAEHGITHTVTSAE